MEDLIGVCDYDFAVLSWLLKFHILECDVKEEVGSVNA